MVKLFYFFLFFKKHVHSSSARESFVMKWGVGEVGDVGVDETVGDVVDVELSVNMKLGAKVMKQLVRGMREFAGGGEGQVGGDQEVRQVFSGDVSGDGCVVAGGSGVFEDSLVVWGEPKELENSVIKTVVGGAKVV